MFNDTAYMMPLNDSVYRHIMSDAPPPYPGNQTKGPGTVLFKFLLIAKLSLLWVSGIVLLWKKKSTPMVQARSRLLKGLKSCN